MGADPPVVIIITVSAFCYWKWQYSCCNPFV